MGPLPLIALSFLVGLALPWSPDPRVAAVGALAFALAAVPLGRRRRLAGAALLLVAAALAGGARRDALTMPRWPRVPAADATRVRGRVVSGCAGDGDHDRCRVDAVGLGLADVRFPRGACGASPGDVIDAVVTSRPLVPLRNPPRDPPELPRVLDGVRWTMDSAACEVTARDASPLDALRGAALRTRRWMERSLGRALPREHAGRARALLFGDRSGLDRAEHEDFRDSGLAHLLAVSGAHVSLLLAAAGAATRRLLARVPSLAARGVPPRAGGLLPLPVVGFFVMVTGEAPSSVRALLTALVGALAATVGRRPRHEPVVALVALAMAAWEPALVADVGWVLSVVASWALARGARADSSAPEPSTLLGHLRGEVAGALKASARVGAAVMPALAWHFGRTPLTATVMNAVAAPVGEALLLPSVLGAVVAGAVLPSWALDAPGRAVGTLLGSLFALPGVALRLPLASVALPMPTPAQWVVATAFLVAACGLRARTAGLALVACAVALVALEVVHRQGLHPRGVVRVTALDVGQGDAIVVELPDGEAMLVDGGGALTGTGPDPGAAAVVPWLALHRRRRLAVVVLSHPHPDHAGGLGAVLRAVEVGELWDTGQGRTLGYQGAYAEVMRAARERGVPVRGPEALCGPPRRFHGAAVEVVAPCPAVPEGTPPNDASFVLRVTHGRARVLLPGDLEREGEAALLSRLGPVDVLKLGHHGSRTSTTEPFLDALRPRVALVSAGHPSPFGHPHPTVVARLRARGVPLLRTDLSGAVSVTLGPDGALWMDPPPP